MRLELLNVGLVHEYDGVAKTSPFTNVIRHITPERLRIAAKLLKQGAASGPDGQSIDRLLATTDLKELAQEIRQGRYTPGGTRQVTITEWKPIAGRPGCFEPKTRELSIPNARDRVVQRALLLILEPILEGVFLPCSYGYRPNLSCHHAIKDLQDIQHLTSCYVLDADLQKFFDTIKVDKVMQFLRLHVTDGVFTKLVWDSLKASSQRVIHGQPVGIPQGGVISPTLANLYAHYVIDLFFEESVRPKLNGYARLIRYADDFVILTTSYQDAVKAKEMVGRRVRQFGTDLHPGKTHIRNMSSPTYRALRVGEGVRRVSFLGFDLEWQPCDQGNWELQTGTTDGRIERAVMRWQEHLKEWEKRVRKASGTSGTRTYLMEEILFEADKRIQGFQAYYGIENNWEALRLHEELVYSEGAKAWMDIFGKDTNPFQESVEPLWTSRKLRKLSDLAGRKTMRDRILSQNGPAITDEKG